MEKAFVNTKQKKVEGTPAFDEKKKQFEAQFPGDKPKVDTALSKEKFLLSSEAGGVLLGIGVDPKLVKPQKSEKITIFDDGTPIVEIDKNMLIDGCAAKRESERLNGISYLVALSDHAVTIDYKFQNRIEAVGDITGLFFFFRK